MTTMFTAVQLAKEMKLPPKRVRAILRKASMTHDGRWRFPMGEKAKLKEVVRNARKKATVKREASAKVARKAPKARKQAEDARPSMH